MNNETRRTLRTTAKYIFLTAVGIALFKLAAVYATAERGYHAVGGEYLILLLPIFYWLLTSMAKDMFREYAEIYAEWRAERKRKRIMLKRTAKTNAAQVPARNRRTQEGRYAK